MKYRKGFVSNSSSSSFCIYGTDIEEEEYRKLNADDNEDGEDKLKGTCLSLESIMGEAFWIGREYSSIEDDETGAQFKKRVEEDIEKVLGKKVKCGYCSEAWRDG